MSTEVPAALWFVYMLRTGQGQLYTGISTDPERRLQQHESGKGGAKSLRGKGPMHLAWLLEVSNRSEASKIEARLKKLSKPLKEQLVAGKVHFSSLIQP